MALSHNGIFPLKPFTKAGFILALLPMGPALNPVQLFAQTASIQGLAVDSTTGIPLESAQSIEVSLQPGVQSEALIRLQSKFPKGDRILVDNRMREQAQGLTRQQKSVNFNTVLPNQQTTETVQRFKFDFMKTFSLINKSKIDFTN